MYIAEWSQYSGMTESLELEWNEMYFQNGGAHTHVNLNVTKPPRRVAIWWLSTPSLRLLRIENTSAFSQS